MNDKIINTIIILAIAAAYSLSSGMNYAEALGFSFGSGLLGYPILYIIDKYVLKGAYSKVSNWRKYAVSVAIFSLIGIPYQINQKKKESIEKEVESSIGESIGKISASCKLYERSIEKYCPAYQISPSISSVCTKQLEELAPQKMQAEIKRIITSQNYSMQIQQLESQLDANYKAASQNKDFNNDAYCQQMESTASETISSNVAKLQQTNK